MLQSGLRGRALQWALYAAFYGVPHTLLLAMGRPLLSLIRGGDTFLIWDAAFAREVLGLPARPRGTATASAAAVGALPDGAAIPGAAKASRKRKRKRKKKKTKVMDVDDGKEGEVIADWWADSVGASECAVAFGPLPKASGASCSSAAASADPIIIDAPGSRFGDMPAKRSKGARCNLVRFDGKVGDGDGGFATVTKLLSRPELVGQKVKLLSHDVERKRYGCELLSTEQCSISEENLLVLYGIWAQSAKKMFDDR